MPIAKSPPLCPNVVAFGWIPGKQVVNPAGGFTPSHAGVPAVTVCGVPVIAGGLVETSGRLGPPVCVAEPVQSVVYGSLNAPPTARPPIAGVTIPAGNVNGPVMNGVFTPVAECPLPWRNVDTTFRPVA